MKGGSDSRIQGFGRARSWGVGSWGAGERVNRGIRKLRATGAGSATPVGELAATRAEERATFEFLREDGGLGASKPVKQGCG
jgi:hypothetical protein